VGANIGLFSLFVHQAAKRTRIYAFEPSPELFGILKNNLEQAGVSAKAFQIGIAEREKQARFFYYPSYTILSGFQADQAQDRELIASGIRPAMAGGAASSLSEQVVRALAEEKLKGRVEYDCSLRSLSSIIAEQGIERIDLLKVDAEKSELDVLRGIAPADWPKIRQLVMEVHDASTMLAPIQELLERQGFSLTVEAATSFKGSRIVNIYGINREQGAARSTKAAPAGPPSAPQPANENRERIVISASFTAELLKPGLEFWLKELELRAEVSCTDYNQIFQVLLSPASALARNARGLNVIALRFDDWLRDLEGASEVSSLGPGALQSLLEPIFTDFLRALESYLRRARCFTLLLLCPASPSDNGAASGVFAGLKARLEDFVKKHASLGLMDAAAYHEAYKVGPIFDQLSDELGHIPFVRPYYHFLATLIARRYFALKSKPYKVIAVDCDNTLWRGVCGEDGPEGVVVDAYLERFQRFLAAKAGQGFLVCLCSKNVEEDVWAVFEQGKMQLPRTLIADSRINWSDKPQNLQSLAASLNLGIDSFLFFDDNPVERAAVRQQCPAVLTVDWPIEGAHEHFLEHLWFLDNFTVTEEDAKRTASYRANQERQALRQSSYGMKEFVANLRLQVRIEEMTAESQARVVQLIHRTNQFNFTTLRRDTAELQRLLSQGTHVCWTVTVSDRFGDYGLVGVLILEKAAPALVVDTFLLSCRVLGRGVEFQIVSRLGEYAKSLGLESVKFIYRKTAKNEPARRFIERIASAYRRVIAEGHEEFLVPASFLAEVRYEPAEEDAEADEADAPVRQPRPEEGSFTAVRQKEQLLLRLCTQLSTVEAISAAVEPRPEAPRPPAPAIPAVSATADAPVKPPVSAPASAPAGASQLMTVMEQIREIFGRVLRRDPAELDVEQSLETYLPDSLKTVELTVELNRVFGEIPATLLFSHRTIKAIAGFICGTRPVEPKAEAASAASPAAPAPKPTPSLPRNAPQRVTPRTGRTGREIAIIGMHSVLPGAETLDAYWNLLVSGQRMFREVPAERWRSDVYYSEQEQPGKTYSKWGSFLSDVDCFDAGFFHVSPKEAETLDPQQRIFLEVAWSLLEGAGYTPETLGWNTGVFVGVIGSDYNLYLNEASLAGGGAYRNSEYYQIPNRVSYSFGFHGPSVAVDTACASSGSAIHLACQSLLLGECDAAIAGGTNLLLHPGRFIQHSQMRTLSRRGVCRPFGEGADGIVLGEGVAAVLLKTLEAAERDGDRILAVIKATATSSSGRTRGFTVPDPVEQAQVISKALDRAEFDPRTISYVEAHGTGTALGDPIEVAGLTAAFRRDPGAQGPFCAIGSVKSNIGHLESAAAISGLIKIVLQMKHGMLVPSLGAEKPNPLIPFAETPFFVQRNLKPWVRPTLTVEGRTETYPRRAGLSSFGAGGVNTHLLLEEYLRPERELPGDESPQLIVLSAADRETLTRYAARLVAFLQERDSSDAGVDPLRLVDIAYTLQTGRVALPERLAFVAKDTRALTQKLKAFAEGKPVGGLLQGNVKTHKALLGALNDSEETAGYVQELWRNQRYDLIAQLWVAGTRIDWSSLRQRPANRVRLPTYPFRRDRYWLPEVSRGVHAGQGEQPAPARVPTPESRELGAEALLLEKTWRAAPLTAGVQRSFSGQVLVLANARTARLAEGIAGWLPWPSTVMLEERLANAAAPEQAESISALIDLTDLDPEHPVGGEQLQARLALLQHLVREVGAIGVAHLTSGLQGFEHPAPSLAGAVFAGFVKMLGAEYRHVNAVTLDVDAVDIAAADTLARIIVQELQAATQGEICYRRGKRYEPALTPLQGAPSAFEVSATDVVLITGGLGSLGLRLARELTGRGVRKLVLTGARALPPREQWKELLGAQGTERRLAAKLRALLELESKGAQLRVYTGALADRERFSRFLTQARADFGAITGVIHCAGTFINQAPSFIDKHSQDIQGTLAPKVEGLLAVHELVQGEPLKYFVLFSSVAALVPSLAVGISDYAAANAFMDAFANWQHRQGRTYFRSIQWPKWGDAEGIGVGVTPAYARTGLKEHTPEQGLTLFDRVMRLASTPCLMPCFVEEERFRAEDLLFVARPAKVLGEGLVARDVEGARAPEGATQMPESSGARLEALLREILANQLKMTWEQIEPEAEFAELGVDSIVVAAIVRDMDRKLGTRIDPSALLEFSTVRALAEHLVTEHADRIARVIEVVSPPPRPAAPMPAAPVPAAPTVSLAPVRPQPVEKAPMAPVMATAPQVLEAASEVLATGKRPEPEKIAIIGMACRFPGAENTEEFWANLAAGKSSIREVPSSRWDVKRFYQPRFEKGKSISKWGGFVEGFEEFDARYFQISEADAATTHPLVRLFLETSVQCLRDAGYENEELWSQPVGIFVGSRMAGYTGEVRAQRQLDNTVGAAQNFIAAHASHFFNFKGPSLVVDTACSSSLVSMHLACQSLRTGECEMAIAGGVDLLLDERPFLELSAAQALSPEGRCFTFDERANGFVPGEGCGAVLLKPLEKALAAGDRIYAVIEASALNNDGRTMGITTPNFKAQKEVIQAALQRGGIDPETISYLEAHGTATMIGDPIELRALSEVFREATQQKQFCAIGSVKTNVGHLLSAAGVASLIKVALSLHHQTLVPTLNCDTPNPRFNFAASPFYPNTRRKDWTPVKGTRRAGMSSFGFGGTNAHLIMGEFDPGRHPRYTQKRQPLPAARFNRVRYWIDEPGERPRQVAISASHTAEAAEAPLPALLELRASSTEQGTRYRTVMTNANFIVRDHRVHEVRIMPGVTFLGLIYRALVSQGVDPRKVELKNITFYEAVATTEAFDREIEVAFEADGAGRTTITASSRKFRDGAPLETEWVRNFQCELVRDQAPLSGRLDPEALKAAAFETLDMDELYAKARQAKIVHYEFMKGLGTVYKADRYLLARLHLPELARPYAAHFLLHPVHLDASTIVLFGMQERNASLAELNPGIPLFIESFRAMGALEQECWVYIQRQSSSIQKKDLYYVDIELYGLDGAPLARFTNLAVKQVRSKDLLSRLQDAEGRRTAPVSERRAVEEPKSAHTRARTEQGDPRGAIEGDLRRRVAALASCQPEALDLSQSFYELGLNSRDLLQLARELEKALSVKLYPTLLFEYGDIQSLAGYFLEQHRDTYLGILESPPPQQAMPGESSKPEIAQEVVVCTPGWERREPSLGSVRGSWLLFDPEPRTRASMQRYLEARGDGPVKIIQVLPAQAFEQMDASTYRLDPADREHITQLLQRLAASGFEPTGLVWNAGEARHDLREASLRRWLKEGFEPFFQLVQLLSGAARKQTLRIFYVYRDDGRMASFGPAALGAVARTVQLEQPKLAVRTIEWLDEADREAWLAELHSTDSELEVRYRSGERWVRRLQLCEPMGDTSSQEQLFRKGGVYLITGGLGGLGRIFAEYLARRWQAKLLLTGRSALGAEQEEMIEQLRSLGSEVLYLRGDVSRLEDVERWVSQARSRFGALNGVLHSAGVLRDNLLVRASIADVEAVVEPKLYGALHLDAATRNDGLDVFILFSSLSSVIGNVGQVGYAFANRLMDGFASFRERLRAERQRSGRTLSINWPLWREGGMQVEEEVLRQMRESRGFVPLETPRGLEAFEQLLRLSGPELIVAVGEREKVIAALEASKAPAGVSQPLAPVQPLPPAVAVGSHRVEDVAIVGLSGRYPAARDLEEFWDNVREGRDCIREVPAERWDVTRHYDAIPGKPGRTASKWGGFINGIDRFDPLFFKLSPRDAESLDPQLRLMLEEAWHAVESAGYTPRSLARGGAVGVFVGVMNDDFTWSVAEGYAKTGSYKSFGSYAHELANRISYFLDFRGPSLTVETACASSLTAIHLAYRSIVSGECRAALAGGVNLNLHPSKYLMLSALNMVSPDGKEKTFDRAANGYVPGEGVGMVVLKPLRDALADGDHIHGVIKASAVNHSGKGAGLFVPNAEALTQLIAQGLREAGVAPERLGYIETHGTGTAVGDPIELRALSRAIRQFTDKRQFCALGTKANLGHLESASGICSLTKVLLSLDKGMIPACANVEQTHESIFTEDFAFYLPRQPARWESQGQPRVAAINSFGAGGANAFLVIEEFIPPAEVLRRTVEQRRPELVVLSARDEQRLREYAAGLAHFLSLESRAPVGDTRLKEIEAIIVATASEILQVAPDEIDVEENVLEYGFTSTQLSHLCYRLSERFRIEIGVDQFIESTTLRSLAKHLEAGFQGQREGREVELSALAYTLQVGRVEMEHRLAILAGSTGQLLERLESFVRGESETPGVYQGNTRARGSAGVQELSEAYERRDLERLARTWVSGGEVDWNRLHAGQPSRRIPLPGYPFARELCPLSPFQSGTIEVESTPRPCPHPLLTEDRSTSERTAFFSRFSPEVFFLADHRVAGKPVLPGVAQLEMARAAAERMTGRPVRRISHVVWTRPVVAGSSLEVLLELVPREGFTAFQLKGAEPGGEASVYSQGRVSFGVEQGTAVGESPTIDLAAIRARCAQVRTQQQVYDLFRNDGSEYRARLQAITSLHFQGHEALASLELPAAVAAEHDRYTLHPSLFDGALQAVTGLITEEEMRRRAPFLPFTLEEAILHGPLPRRCFAYVTLAPQAAQGDRYKRYDVKVTDEAGRVLLALNGFTVRPYQDALQPTAQAMASHSPGVESGTGTASSAGAEGPLYQRFTRDLVQRISAMTKLPEDRIDLSDELSDYGFTSITFVELCNQLNDTYGLDVMPTVFFEHSRLESLAAHLFTHYRAKLSSHYGETQPEWVQAWPAVQPPVATSSLDEPIAIIGMAGVMPQSEDLEAFWSNLEAGRDLVSELPRERWEAFGYTDGQERLPITWGGWLSDVERFDAAFFRISPREAALMDPQQRIFLEVAWKAIEDAGYRPSSLSGTDTGVFVGVAGTDYYDVIKDLGGGMEAYAVTGAEHSILANRLSFLLNLHGPSEPVNTACSSSLVAIHRALESLRSGTCSLAIAGGVNVFSSAALFSALHDARMLSPDGRCKAFAKGANGYVRGEGAGVVLLKPLSRALADGDHVHGIIRGTSIKHGGRASSLTAPNMNLQAQLLLEAYRRAGVDPSTVSYLEAHGTGTELGDPVEINAIKSAFEQLVPGPTDARISIGTVKTNIGHLEAAAGIAGVLKVLLSFKHQKLIGNIHLSEVNPYIRLSGTPLQLLKDNQPWETRRGADGAPLPRRAGVSSFGFGGVYAHVVLEEPSSPVAPRSSGEEEPQLFVLSAQDGERLRAYAARWARSLEGPLPSSLADLAFTLQTGREAMPARLAAVVSRPEQLRELLARHARGELPGEGLHVSEVADLPSEERARGAEASKAEVLQALSARDWERLARLWVTGVEVDWSRAHPAGTRRRVPLPTYPFGGERHWVGSRTRGVAPAAGKSAVSFYAPVWSDAPWAERPEKPLAMPVLILGLESGPGRALWERLERSYPGAELIAVTAGQDFRRRDARHYEFRSEVEQDYRRLIEALAEEGRLPRTVIHLGAHAWSTEPTAELPERLGWGVRSLFLLCQALLRHPTAAQTQLYYVFQRRDAGGAAPEDSAIGALAQALYQENPRIVCKSVELDGRAAPTEQAEWLWRELHTSAADWEVRFLSGARQSRGYQSREPARVEASSEPFREKGTYLISGGAGRLGLIVAEHLATSFRANLVLLGRSALRGEAEEAIGRMRRAGSEVLYLQADLADRSAVIARVRQARERFGQIHGVIHAAGLARDAFALNKSMADFLSVIAPKVYGARHLDEALAEERLDCFLLFSSFAAVHGNAGQTDYAYANRFLEEFAEWREAQRANGRRHGRTLALGWPWWREGGMPLSAEQLRELEERTGLTPLSKQEGLQALRQAWALPGARLVIATGDEGRLTRYVRGEHRSVRFEYEVATAQPAAHRAPARPAAEASELVAATEQYLKDVIGTALGIPAERMETRTSFERYGLDSIAVHRFNSKVQESLENLPKTLLYEHKNIHELARHLAATYPEALASLVGGRLKVRADTSTHLARAPERPSAAIAEQGPGSNSTRQPTAGGDIAIIGVSGRYPMAPDLDTFWENLKAGRDCITPIPRERWDAEQYDVACKWGGFLTDVDKFDPFFFNIPPREAMLRDPQERLFLEVSWTLLEGAGYPRRRLELEQRRDVGVFVGVTTNTYEAIASEAWGQGQVLKTNAYPWSIANQVSYFLDLSGPSVPVDTACSSSLTAIHLACESLKRGECRMAIVGGVNLYLHPSKYVGMSQVGMLSPTGRCHTFGAQADGMVPGEGVGAVLLKPLAAAQADGDRILGVIKSTAINHGGRTSGYTVPNPNAQAELILDALKRGGIDPSTLSYIEAHGTGTLLGDPIEITALSRAFREYTPARQFCAIGSVKSNIGHLEAAAGIAGLTKVLLQLRHRQLVPSLHAAEPNPNIDFPSSPFFVQQATEEWRRPATGQAGVATLPLRRAGISSFGAGGANAHVLIEEYPAEVGQDTSRHLPPPYLCVLSAKNEERLKAYAQRLLTWLESHPALDMGAVAYTLQQGREPFEERLALVAGDQAELSAQLRQFLQGTLPGKGYRGSLKSGAGSASLLLDGREGQEFVRIALADKRLPKLAQLWTQGVELDWRMLYDGQPPRCIELPTYPFEARRCWLQVEEHQAPRPQPEPAARPAVIEPLPAAPAPAPVSARPTLAALKEKLRKIVAEALLTDVSDVSADSEFSEYGVDSILIVDIVNRINAAFGLELKPSQIFSYPSVATLASFLLEEHGAALSLPGSEPQPPPRVETPAPRIEVVSSAGPVPSLAGNAYPEIAIIGMSGRFPDAEDVHQFWDNLRSGRNSIREIPADRWDFRDYYDPDPEKKNKTYCKYGSFLSNVDKFDPLFFNIAPKEARQTDPQQRLFLEEAWRALEDAGYPSEEVSNSRCGVFVGVAQGDYETFSESDLKARQELAAYSMVGPVSSMLAARVSHFLNLKGPSMSVDTTCSSSLVALHMACQSLHSGESELAIAGGVYVRFSPLLYILASRSGALSPDGQCKAFDNDADGFGIGEAVAAVVLKPLHKALADGDHIYGVIKSSGINHDGRTNGILAPNGKSQAALELEVYRRGNIHPETIGYVEAHATGTKLGDPIELDALTAAFRQYTDRKRFCPIGTVKSNIGHCVTASGAVGLVKVLLSMRHELLPPSLLCNRENEHIDFENSPFFVNKTLRPWRREEGRVRRAAISSFGFSGTNCHVVVEEPPLAGRRSAPGNMAKARS
jgi:FkbH-like protein/FkbM family methyltransferase